MNSLAYLSRQFDVLASPRTPPSTPTLETAPLLADHDAASLKRVQTWSTRSLASADAVESVSYSSWSLKRSYSSPDVQPGEPSSSAVPLPTPKSTPAPVAPTPRPSSRRSSMSSSEKALRHSEDLFHRIYFVHVLFALWHYLCGVWRSIRGRVGVIAEHEAAAEDVSDEEEKETEDESKGEKPVTLQVEQPPPIPPPILPAVLASPAMHRANSDTLLDVKPPVTDPSPAATARAAETPRASTPVSGARKQALHLLPKTLVLDLDETLIHSTSRPMHSQSMGSNFLGTFGFAQRNKGSGHTVEVTLGGRSTLYHVYKRPFVDYFLRKVSAWYTLVIFTASMQEYADPVIDWLDAGRGILGRRFFRESCTQLPNGSYTKDLSIIEQDLSRVCLVDNSPICYSINEANGIPIEGWTNDPHDEALLDLLPVLDSLRFTNDVRRVLGIRGFSS